MGEEADADRALSSTAAGPSAGNKSGSLAVETPIQAEPVPVSSVVSQLVSVGVKSFGTQVPNPVTRYMHRNLTWLSRSLIKQIFVVSDSKVLRNMLHNPHASTDW